MPPANRGIQGRPALLHGSASSSATARLSCDKLLAVADSSAIEVLMCPTTADVPQETLRAAQKQVEEIARELGKVDRQGPFWASLRESGLSLEVQGWKFKFDVGGDALVLAQVGPLPSQTPDVSSFDRSS